MQSDAIHVAVDAATSGNNTLVAAVASTKLRVLALVLNAGGAVTATLESAAGGTALTGAMSLAADGSTIVLPYNPLGWCETAAGALLNLSLSGAVQVSGVLVYTKVT